MIYMQRQWCSPSKTKIPRFAQNDNIPPCHDDIPLGRT